VSDFVLPRYFDPVATTGPFDFKGHLSSAFSLAPGGYMSLLDLTAGTWTHVHAQDDGELAPGADPTRPGGGTRKDRRGRPRADWRRFAT